MEHSTSKSQEWWDRFEKLLEQDRTWPSEYLFKFIVPRPNLEELQGLFGDHPVIVRASSRGRYVSVTARLQMETSASVVAVYRAAGEIPGVISL
jgi:hypothetical protein